MFETSQVLVVVHADDVDRYENLTRIHAGDGRVRVIFDRRRHLQAPTGHEPPPERRHRGAQHWKDGHLVIETGYS